MRTQRPRLLALVLLATGPAARAADRPIELYLDATDAPRNRLRATLTIPASPGPLVLSYPKYIPGEHGPSGPVGDVAGLTFRAGGKSIPWLRDEEDAFTFRVVVPDGATDVRAELEFLPPPAATRSGFSKGASCTPSLAVLSWNQVLLCPAGKPISAQTVRPSVTVPEGWSVGCAMPVVGNTGAKTDFGPVSIETLCDSPALCGRHYKEVPIGPRTGPRHLLCLAGDTPAAVDISPEVKACFDKLVTETADVFGGPHYRSYRFLVALSDHLTHFGLEHHECSDNRGPEGMLTDPLYRNTWHAWLLCHEFVHSWNGKYRRPAGLVVPDYQKPIRSRLLWVYEGMTHYYGFVLASRAGIWKPERAREYFARIADRAVRQPGRGWRALDDTAATAYYGYASRDDGWYRRRGVDFYDEGALVWLDADTLIREGTKGTRSLDDFCARFFGGPAGPPAVSGYEFEDVVRTLNDVYPHDWKAFLEDRVMKAGAEPPLAGLTRGGWQLGYAAERTEHLRSLEADTKTVDLSASAGFVVKDDGTVAEVVPGSPADAAGVGAGMKLIAVNDRRWTTPLLRAAVAGAKGPKGTLTLVAEQSDFVKSFTLAHAGGESYPTLTRRPGHPPDLLGEVLAPRADRPDPKP